MIKSIPFYQSLLRDGATQSEILLYGLIEVLSYNLGYCYASSEALAKELGFTNVGSVKNLLSSLKKRNWVHIDLDSQNHRLAIYPLLNLTPKTEQENVCEVVENSASASLKNDAQRHSKMTPPSLKNDAEYREITDKGYNKIIKQDNKEKIKESPQNTTAGCASMEASQPSCSVKTTCWMEADFPKRKDFESTRGWMEAIKQYKKQKKILLLT